jgi:hypothetical protein
MHDNTHRLLPASLAVRAEARTHEGIYGIFGAVRPGGGIYLPGAGGIFSLASFMICPRRASAKSRLCCGPALSI